MQAVLLLTKPSLKTHEVSPVDVPLWTELSIANVWVLAMQIENFKDYLPADWKPANHKVERAFFWNILSALNPEFVDQLITNCRDQRT